MSKLRGIKMHGGQFYHAPWIRSNFPPRDTWHLYREAYAGGLSVLLQLDPEGLSEAVNDIDGNLTNFWQMFQRPDYFEEFQRILAVTPFSQTRFEEAHSEIMKWAETQCVPASLSVQREVSIARAVNFFVLARQSRQGLRKEFATPTTRLRRNMNENVSAWMSSVDGLFDVYTRMRRVEVRNMHAPKFIKQYDDKKAMHYLDPTFLPETRTGGGGEYEHEMTPEDHEELLDTLSTIEGRFALSGYPSSMYESHAKKNNWRMVQREASNSASSKKEKALKVTCLWMNY